jgi:hypothetical protein
MTTRGLAFTLFDICQLVMYAIPTDLRVKCSLHSCLFTMHQVVSHTCQMNRENIVTCISVARKQLGKHVPVKKNSWPTTRKGLSIDL